MRPLALVVLCLGLAACGTPPVDTGRTSLPAPPRSAEVPAVRRPPPPPAPQPEPPPPPTVALPAVPPASITRRSVYPTPELTEWTLANGARVVFHRTDGPLALVARADGGAGSVPEDLAGRARGAAAVRSGAAVRASLRDVDRRLVGEGDASALADALGSVFSGAMPASGPVQVPAVAALSGTQSAQDGGARLFAETFADPAGYTVGIAGDAEIEAVEAFLAAAFTAAGRRTLAFEPSAPALPTAPTVTDAGTGDRRGSIVYRGRLERGEDSAVLAVALAAAARALDRASVEAAVRGQADLGSGLYEIVVTLRDARSTADGVAAAAAALAGARADGIDALRRIARSRVDAVDRAQHVLNWAVGDASPLRFDPLDVAITNVSQRRLAGFLERAFAPGVYSAVLGLTLTP